jgi:hypothetical protein
MNCQCIFFLFAFLVLLSLGPFVASAITVEITATVPGCGDGVIETGEQCDGSNLGGSSCSSLGFTSGSLSCSSACTFNTSQCTSGGGGGGGGGGAIASLVRALFVPRISISNRVDLNGDGRINIADLSILLYYYNTQDTNEDAKKLDFDGDGKITIKDISILFYYWNPRV